MKNTPKAIKDVLLQIAAEDNQTMGKMLRKCPCIQAELINQDKMQLEELTDEKIDKLVENYLLEDWIDNQDVMQLLHISLRTLQTLRTNGTLPYSRIGNKLFYRKQDIKKILADNYTMFRLRNGYGSNR